MTDEEKKLKLFLIECPNCGKQVETNGSPGEKCYWCNQPLQKPVFNKEKGEDGVEPIHGQRTAKRGGNTRERSRYYLQHQREIIVTFLQNGYGPLYTQWGITRGTWSQSQPVGLQRRWHEEIVKVAKELGIEYDYDIHLKKVKPKAKSRPEGVLNMDYWVGYRQAVLDIFGDETGGMMIEALKKRIGLKQ